MKWMRGVYHNVSRDFFFADGYRLGSAPRLASATVLHARGPMGMEGLTTYKYKLVGDGMLSPMYEAGDRTLKPRNYLRNSEIIKPLDASRFPPARASVPHPQRRRGSALFSKSRPWLSLASLPLFMRRFRRLALLLQIGNPIRRSARERVSDPDMRARRPTLRHSIFCWFARSTRTLSRFSRRRFRFA